MRQLLLFLALTFFVFGCKKDDAPVPDNNTGNNTVAKGFVTGKVVTANNKTVVRNATVFVAVGKDIYHTYTDVNGNFSLEAPAGQRILHIQSGSGRIFRTSMSINVTANETTAVSTSSIQLAQIASLAFLPGTYDKIQAILMDSLGYTATPINYSHLHNLNALSQYNAVFINCSNDVMTDPLQDSVLASYVSNGGSLYISDYAVTTLIGNYGPACPGPRLGGFIPDSKLCTQRLGSVGMIYNTNIVAPSLQTYLNKNLMDLKYDLGAWEAVQNYDQAFWEVMVRHPATNAPLLIRTSGFSNGTGGSVNIGGSSNNGFVTVCHKPQGTSPITITIPASDLTLHMAHGDSPGSCSSANGAGRIYFTTFHTQPNGLISADMKHILDYIILNL